MYVDIHIAFPLRLLSSENHKHEYLTVHPFSQSISDC